MQKFGTILWASNGSNRVNSWTEIDNVRDAAHTVHPLAGQGLNLGLKDAKALGDVIRKAIEEGQDVGRKNILEQYGEQQKRSDALMMGMIEGAWQVFRGEHPVIGRMRELGMGFINGSQWLKSIIVKMAS
jgi:2-octaprenylphenol hydroxylase